jgi:predicted ATP-binding protein involved in virulence
VHLEEIRRRLAPSQEYAGLNRQLINRWFDELGVEIEGLKRRGGPLIRRAASKARLVTEEEERDTAEDFLKHAARQQRYSVEGEAPEDKEAFYAGKKSIEWVEIQNFKAIERLELTFPEPTTDKEPWLMLLGENGMGKSSLLQGIALTLMGEEHSRELGLDASSFVYRGARRGGGLVRVKLTNIPEALEVRFRRSSTEFFFETPDPKVLLLGYGATRLLPPRGTAPDSDPNYIRIKNLFDPTARLSDIESWLLDKKNVGAARFKAVTAALKDLLMLESDDSIVRRGGDLNVNVRGQPPVGLTQLSAGFQSVVALSADIMKSLLERFSSIREAEGIVLLDELEAHLHPTWKIQIVERLRRTLPRVSFVVSTHDPLSLKGLEAGEIVVLRRDERRRIVADTDIPPVNDLRADQLLTSFLFGLDTTRGDEATAKITRYSELSEKRQLTRADQRELDQLRQRLDDTLTTRESPIQRRIEEAILNTLAEMESVAPSQPQRHDAPTAQEFELRRQLNELLGRAD